jgi:hypothetical protein
VRTLRIAALCAGALCAGCAGNHQVEREFSRDLAACQAMMPPRDSPDNLSKVEAYRRAGECMNRADSAYEAAYDRRTADTAAALGALRAAGQSLQATGDDMLNRPRPSLSAPPSPPPDIGPPSNLGAHYLPPPPLTAPGYCTNTPLGLTGACPH